MLNLIFSECQLFLPINQILHLDLCSFFFFFTLNITMKNMLVLTCNEGTKWSKVFCVLQLLYFLRCLFIYCRPTFNLFFRTSRLMW